MHTTARRRRALCGLLACPNCGCHPAWSFQGEAARQHSGKWRSHRYGRVYVLAGNDSASHLTVYPLPPASQVRLSRPREAAALYAEAGKVMQKVDPGGTSAQCRGVAAACIICTRALTTNACAGCRLPDATTHYREAANLYTSLGQFRKSATVRMTAAYWLWARG